jgi:hypothetical protein
MRREMRDMFVKDKHSRAKVARKMENQGNGNPGKWKPREMETQGNGNIRKIDKPDEMTRPQNQKNGKPQKTDLSESNCRV